MILKVLAEEQFFACGIKILAEESLSFYSRKILQKNNFPSVQTIVNVNGLKEG